MSAEQQQTNSVSTSINFAQVEFVEVKQSSDKNWCFNTRVRHQDDGWDHYANAWQVHDMNGKLLAERVLFHPHENEQPFTRSLCNIDIPENVTKVVVSAQCEQHGLGGQVVLVDLTAEQGTNFTVKRY